MLVRVYSSDGKQYVDVQVNGVTQEQYDQITQVMVTGMKKERTAYIAVGQAMITAVSLCPNANPADLWVHVLYHQYRAQGCGNDQSWKRVSGDAFQYVMINFYAPRLRDYNIIIRYAKPNDAITLGLKERGPGGSKTDLILEGTHEGRSYIFG